MQFVSRVSLKKLKCEHNGRLSGQCLTLEVPLGLPTHASMHALTHAHTQWTSIHALLVPPFLPLNFSQRILKKSGQRDGSFSGLRSWYFFESTKTSKQQFPLILFIQVWRNHLVTATFVLQGLKSNPKLVFDGESHHTSIFQCGKDLSENVSSHLQNLLFELHLFRLLNKRWLIGQSKALNVFPRLRFVTCFPALGTRWMCSHAYPLSHVSPRLATVVCFPALGNRCVFSRA